MRAVCARVALIVAMIMLRQSRTSTALLWLAQPRPNLSRAIRGTAGALAMDSAPAETSANPSPNLNRSARRLEEGERLHARNSAVRDAVAAGASAPPLKAFTSPELRRRLRLSGREKRARLFLPADRRGSLEALDAALRETFPLAGLPYVVKVKAGEAEKRPLASDDDLASALAWAEAGGLDLHVYVEPDPTVPEPEAPDYLKDLPCLDNIEEWQVVSFYRFVDLPDPAAFANLLQPMWRALGARGRIYVAREGINAQMAVPVITMPRFEAAIESIDKLKGTFLNCDTIWSGDQMREAEEKCAVGGAGAARNFPFEGLHVRVRDQVLADGLAEPLEWSGRAGREMSAAEWHNAISAAASGAPAAVGANNVADVQAATAAAGASRAVGAPRALVLDCRNDYESDVGRFDAAVPLNTSFFRESWDVLRETLADTPRDTPLLTYCTGGIRCVKVAKFLEQEMGFSDVARLEGGVVSYARFVREAGVESRFRGKNYVFDQRMGERVTDDVLSGCDQCGDPCDEHVNCANPRCHVRFIQCAGCGARYGGCCSRGCHQSLAAMASATTLQPLPRRQRPTQEKAGAPRIEEALRPKISGLAATETAAAATATTAAVGTASKEAAATKADAGSNIARLVAQSSSQPQYTEASPQRAPGAAPTVAAAGGGIWLEPQPFQDARLNRGMDDVLESYCAGMSSPEPPLLAELRRETAARQPAAAHMVSSPVQGRLLSSLAALIGAKRVLEVGTFTGYSALCFAEALPEGGEVVTCEVDPQAAEAAGQFFRRSEHGGKISLRLGPALETIDSLLSEEEGAAAEPFDVIFIDGDKRGYMEYYDRLMQRPGRLLRKGGLLLADNTLFRGMVPEAAAAAAETAAAAASGQVAGTNTESGSHAEAQPDAKTKRLRRIAQALHAFNEHVRADPRTEQVLLPIRDGLTLVRWKG